MLHVAVDWSGADGARAQAQAIFTATVDAGGELVELAGGRTRDEVADHLIALAREDPDLVVGLDFGFSLPAWSFQALGVAGPPELWATPAAVTEAWLAEPRWPFWRNAGPLLFAQHREAAFRQTELEVALITGANPSSIFKLVGAGQVGPGSVRGFRTLHRLTEAGFAVWPFDGIEPGRPTVVEIYPRLCFVGVVQNNPTARAAWLRERFPAAADGRHGSLAVANGDAFDAAASALTMAATGDLRSALARQPLPEQARVEGAIWRPML